MYALALTFLGAMIALYVGPLPDRAASALNGSRGRKLAQGTMGLRTSRAAVAHRTMPSHTFLFPDLAGFTALTEAMGDEEAANLVANFCSAVGELLPEHGAQEVKEIGDALMIRASDAADAVRLGLRIVN